MGHHISYTKRLKDQNQNKNIFMSDLNCGSNLTTLVVYIFQYFLKTEAF